MYWVRKNAKTGELPRRLESRSVGGPDLFCRCAMDVFLVIFCTIQSFDILECSENVIILVRFRLHSINISYCSPTYCNMARSH